MSGRKIGGLVAAAAWLAAGPARAQTPTAPATDASPAPASEGHPEAIADPPLPAPPPPPAPEPPLPGTTWRTSLYGFVEMNAMHDTTQSYGPASNNAVMARPGTYAASHARTQFTANNSLVGVRVAAPEHRRMRASGQVEIDFFGVPPTDATEQTTFTAPSVRMRLFFLRLETPFIDLLAGQYHDLFGWGGEGFYPNSVAFLGVAGELYHRNPQIRLSKGFGGRALRLDIAAAAVRPVQRDSEMPDVQGGIKIAVPLWKGVTAQGFGQPAFLPLAIGLSGVGRRFAVAEFLTVPGSPRTAYGWGVAANVFLPVIPAQSAARRGNALSITGELSRGTGIADLYTGLTGGALFPLLPDPSGAIMPPPIYRPNIDSGIVTYDANANLKTIDWSSFVVGLQYYLPVADGSLWISATLSRLKSDNILALTPEASRGGVFIQQDYADGNVFLAVAPTVLLGLSYQITEQTFGDLPFGGPHPKGRNQRAELGFRFFF